MNLEIRKELRSPSLAISRVRVIRNLKANGGFSPMELETLVKVLRSLVREFPVEMTVGELLRKLDDKRITFEDLERAENMLAFLTRV